MKIVMRYVTVSFLGVIFCTAKNKGGEEEEMHRKWNTGGSKVVPEIVGTTQGIGKQLIVPALACLAQERACHQPHPDPALTDIPV